MNDDELMMSSGSKVDDELTISTGSMDDAANMFFGELTSKNEQVLKPSGTAVQETETNARTTISKVFRSLKSLKILQPRWTFLKALRRAVMGDRSMSVIECRVQELSKESISTGVLVDVRSSMLARDDSFIDYGLPKIEIESENEEDFKKDVGEGAPIDILPEEICLDIFEKLGSADMLTCHSTTHKWQRWLNYKRAWFLFDKVAPFLLGRLQDQDLLNIRRVCHAWKEGLDLANQSHFSHVILYGELELEVIPIKVNVPKLYNVFDSPSDIQDFLDDMEFHTGNPFPGRNVRLICHDILDDDEYPFGEEEMEEFWKNATKLLEAFGEHIYYITFCFYETDELAIDMDEFLDACLQRVPNLRKLSLYGNTGNLTHGDLEVAQWFYKDNKLPRFLYLESVTIYTDTHALLLKAVLESCCVPEKITRLELKLGRNIRSLPKALCNLMHLEVLILRTGAGIRALEGFRVLERPPPLQRIHLGFLRSSTDFYRVFSWLEIFAGTLVTFKMTSKLVYHADERLDVEEPVMVNLPKLEILKLLKYDGPLDPFLGLAGLKTMKVKFSTLRLWEGSEVPVYGFVKQMQRSKIWMFIPSLQTLVIFARKLNGSFFGRKYHRLMETKKEIQKEPFKQQGKRE